jgi:DNA-binding MarR family transcriptional regulator
MKPALKRSRQELLRRVGQELGREMSAQTIFFHEVAARKMGLNATDTRCLDLISRAESSEVTAGDLGRATGLTTGAVTGILDRLEKARLVERVRDTNDRRRVIVRPLPEAAARLGNVYEGLGAAMAKLASGYKTTELELICDFLERQLLVLQEQIARIA